MDGRKEYVERLYRAVDEWMNLCGDLRRLGKRQTIPVGEMTDREVIMYALDIESMIDIERKYRE